MILHRADSSEEWRPVKPVCSMFYGQILVEELDRPIPGRFIVNHYDLVRVDGDIRAGRAA